jgi:hypothetical protein
MTGVPGLTAGGPLDHAEPFLHLQQHGTTCRGVGLAEAYLGRRAGDGSPDPWRERMPSGTGMATGSPSGWIARDPYRLSGAPPAESGDRRALERRGLLVRAAGGIPAQLGDLIGHQVDSLYGRPWPTTS